MLLRCQRIEGLLFKFHMLSRSFFVPWQKYQDWERTEGMVFLWSRW